MLPLDGGLTRPARVVNLIGAIVRRPRRLTALLRLLAGVPSERVYLSDSPAGQILRGYFDQRLLGVMPKNRLCRGVLVLPRQHADYLRGRRRQALRTNLRHAARAGIRCELCRARGRALEAARVVVRQRRAGVTEEDRLNLTEAWPVLFQRPGTTLMTACDPAGGPLAVMAAVIDDKVCLILVAVASSHPARWALHDHLVRVLIARGVTYLLAEGDGPFGALGFEPGMRHYQRLLGYELRHLIPNPTARSAHAGAAVQSLSPARY
ncbi:MAG: hypothetical protein JO023_20930 [Chloroflexi bacterium]|nr:hypothetical protein [Chloroflexota bacterium]